MRISDWSSDVCYSDLIVAVLTSIRSLGPIGIGLLTALFAAAAWVMADNHVLDIEDPRAFTLTLLVILATVYGLGISWSHLRNRLSGQVDSTDKIGRGVG